MSATDHEPEFGPDLETDEAQVYFQAVEGMFSRARGSSLELAPRDRAIAVSWFRRGIPYDFVAALVPELLAKRRERNPRVRWNSLRYCAPKVEEAWAEVEALNAAGRTAPAPVLAVRPRLEALSELLPASLPERSVWQQRILALEGSSQAVEDGLAELDRALLAAVEAALASAERTRLEQSLISTLARLATRLPAAELEAARAQLLRRELRLLFELPMLSLFALEIEPESA